MTIKKSKLISAIMAMGILCLAPVASVYAITPSYPYKYQNGVGNIAAWINYASGVGYWQTYIDGGINNWMYTGWSNPIYINVVGSSYGSNMDFHLNYDAYFGGNMDTYAGTEWYLSNGTQMFSSNVYTDWYYAEIHINDDTFRLPSYPNAAAQGTVRHEMGHAFGLKHYNSSSASIMREYISGRTVQSVQYEDNDAINAKY